MDENLLSILQCPITKERLNFCEKDVLEKIIKDYDETDKIKYLINEGKSFLYPISLNGIPILLVEESIGILNKNNLDTKLQEHRSHLENVYKKINFEKNPFEISNESYLYLRTAVTKPLVENLIEGTVLDAGGGFGFFRRFTSGRFHLNLDVSEQMLNYDKSEIKILGRTENIPLPDNFFDNVVSVGSIEHCYDVEKTLNELSRCLKHNGRLLLACYSDDWPKLLGKSIWNLTYYAYMIEVYYLMFKRNPSLFIQRCLDKLKIKPMKDKKTFGNLWGGAEQGKINNRLFNPEKLETLLIERNLKIIKKGRCGKNFPGKLSPPIYIIDKFFDSNKYGQYLFFVCEKK